MKTFSCQCGNQLFFENTHCVACDGEVGWCPGCQKVTLIQPAHDATYLCADPGCRAPLVKCDNYQTHDVCNRCVVLKPPEHAPRALCDYCRYNDTIPDLSHPGNLEKWRRLEQAKRRLLYSLDRLGLPYGNAEEGAEPPLSFDFKADGEGVRAKPSGLKADSKGRNKHWWSMGGQERVYTGHADGKITINLREADAVEREKARVNFHEAHRTIIGHFRHEIGHYYWQMLVQNQQEAEFKQCFGDHEQPPYSEAQQRYYKQGPPDDWRQNFVSAYASMHPWEDFAESFAAYLDLVSVLDTALHMELSQGCDPADAEFDEMVASYQKLGIIVNELNRAMGLIDLVPEVFTPQALDKLQYVHHLVREHRTR